MNGWLKLWRSWREHELSRDPKGWLVATHLLCRAATTTRENRRFGYTLQPGQCDETQEQLAAATGLTRQEIREALRRLNQYGTITCNQAGNQRRTVITLVNWARYNANGSGTTDETTEKQPTEQPTNNQSRRSREVLQKTTERQKPHAGFVDADGPLELTTPRLKAAEEPIRRWLRYKREKRQGYQPEGLAGLLRKLDGYTDINAAVEHSIANNWAGCFEPNGNGKAKNLAKVGSAYAGNDSQF